LTDLCYYEFDVGSILVYLLNILWLVCYLVQLWLWLSFSFDNLIDLGLDDFFLFGFLMVVRVG